MYVLKNGKLMEDSIYAQIKLVQTVRNQLPEDTDFINWTVAHWHITVEQALQLVSTLEGAKGLI